MTETFRLADQIRRAFEGNAWHGDSVLELLAGVNAKTAAARPIKNAHSIWELLLHIAAWDDAVRRRIGGTGGSSSPTSRISRPSTRPAKQPGRQAIESTKTNSQRTHQGSGRLSRFTPAEQVPGKTQNYYNFYYMFSGIVQHELYHAGQIALLKKAAE